MARIVLGSYMVRYPLGGMMSWVLQWIVGFQRLGHEIYFVEKAGYPDSCYDPMRDVMSDDCAYGTATLHALLSRFDLGERWCFVDAAEAYHGMERARVEEVLASADAFVDMGTHGSWLPEAERSGTRVLVDGEPGFTQMKMQSAIDAGLHPPDYDFYFTTGQNIGTSASSAPTGGHLWRHVFHPVVPELFADGESSPLGPAANVTTVMNWQSYAELEYGGRRYGHKDREFSNFLDLPSRVSVPFEVAVSGKSVPRDQLEAAGWHVRDAHQVTLSFDSFRDYVTDSIAEFSVCKHGYVATDSGWFSDRSAAYLAAGRPVVLQDTGYSQHLPTGRGLFAPRTAEEAAEAIEAIRRDYRAHARAAREIALEHLDAREVLASLLAEIGIPSP